MDTTRRSIPIRTVFLNPSRSVQYLVLPVRFRTSAGQSVGRDLILFGNKRHLGTAFSAAVCNSDMCLNLVKNNVQRMNDSGSLDGNKRRAARFIMRRL